MSTSKNADRGAVQTVIEQALERSGREADPEEVADVDDRLEELLERVAEPSSGQGRPVAQAQPGQATGTDALRGVAMRTAHPLKVHGRSVSLRARGVADEVAAELAPGVSPELVQQAVRTGDAVVVECAADEAPLVVGVLQTQLPRELKLQADKVHIEGRQELLLRSGRGAMRIRQDGDVELVGSRIAAMSRGLFRLVGRVLRLN